MQHPPLPTLPFHLMLSLSAWTSSTIASAWLKNAWPANALPPEHQSLLAALPEQVAHVAKHNLDQWVEGVRRYQAAETPARMPELPTVWQHGAARLLYAAARPGADHASTVLLVPSLINRYYILDLAPDRSFAHFLAREGFDVLLLDWGDPGEAERTYACADYVTGPLARALHFAENTSGAPVHLMGYCMGGVLALAAAQLYARTVASLTLLATPWDFASTDRLAPTLDPALAAMLEQWLNTLDTLPPALLQLLFYWSEPWIFQEKFRRFAEMKEGSPAWREFLALEGWVNDGVPLARGAARDCLVRWGQENALARGQWRVDGRVIDPRKIRCPALVAAPTEDRIVPPGCALPLAGLLPDASLIQPETGHVGMMAGRRAQKEVWEKAVDFCLENN